MNDIQNLNTVLPFFANPRVDQAKVGSVDKEQLNKNIFLGAS